MLNSESLPCSRLEPVWIASDRLRRSIVPGGLRDWLLDRGSLTAKLKDVCPGSFAVNLLRQEWGRALYSENRLLEMRQGITAIVREVELQCDGIPLVFARTLIPATSLRGGARRLTMLGNRPLGEVLFNDRAALRGGMEIARLLPRHSLFVAAAGSLNTLPAEIWGRRTLFYLAGAPLLVNEIFLPAITGHPE